MNLTVQGKQIDLGDALRGHVSDKLEDLNQKYFNRAIEATVTFAPEASFIKTHISIRVGKDILVISDATEKDPYVSFDQAAEKVAKQLRRYKSRLRDHHETADEALLPAYDYTLSVEQDNVQEDVAEHLVIAELVTSILTLTPSDAAMHLDLSGKPALMFKNAHHKGFNMVYRRPDGNIGWVDPDGKATTVKGK